MGNEPTYSEYVVDLMGITKGRFNVPALVRDGERYVFSDLEGRVLGADDYVQFTRGYDADGNFIPASRSIRPMMPQEYLDYQEQSFGSAHAYLNGYITRTQDAVVGRLAEMDSAVAEVEKYKTWAESSKDNRVDLYFNKQKLKAADAELDGILESTIAIPNADDMQKMLIVAEQTDNILAGIQLKRQDLRNWNNLPEIVQEHYVGLNPKYATPEGRAAAIDGFGKAHMNTSAYGIEQLEALEGKAPLVVLGEGEFADRTVAFGFDLASKATTSAYAFVKGAKLGNMLGKETKEGLSKNIVGPLLRRTKIAIGGTGLLADAVGGILVEDAAASAHDALILQPKMNVAIDAGVYTQEIADLAQERMIAENQHNVGGVLWGLDGVGIELPIVGEIRGGDMSKVAALYYGDIEMSGEHIPSKGTNFGQFVGKVEGNEEEIGARHSAMGELSSTVQQRYEKFKASRNNNEEVRAEEQKTPLNPTEIDNNTNERER